MYNYKIILEYEGTRYNGWQRQGNTPNTIQEILEKTIGQIVGEKVEVNGSGRTDAGVHASGQVANFKTTKGFSTDFLIDSINIALPSDIRIIKCEAVNERFHSRLNAREKTYIYNIDTSKKPNVFTRRTIQHYPYNLDIDKMKRATTHLIGEKDFKAYTSNKRTKKSTVRTIYSIEIVEKGSEISIIYKGNGFLYNMVRILTGTLLEVGTGKIKPEEIDNITNSRDRAKAGPTVSPRGLVLFEVGY